jgi:hypothetical protein
MAATPFFPLAWRRRAAAAALNLSTRTLRELTMPRGPIPCIRVGTGRRPTILYPVSLLQAWLARAAAEAQGLAAEPGEPCPVQSSS